MDPWHTRKKGRRIVLGDKAISKINWACNLNARPIECGQDLSTDVLKMKHIALILGFVEECRFAQK